MSPAVRTNERFRPSPVRYKYLLLITTLSAGSLLLISFNTRLDLFPLHNSKSWHRRYEFEDLEDSYTIKTEGCTIPGLKPFDESIKKYIEVGPKKVDSCRNANISLLDFNDTHIWIVRENLKHYKVSSSANITCCYTWFYRPTTISDIKSPEIDERVQYGKCVEFYNSIYVSSEFVKVSCRYKHKALHDQFFIFAVKKPMNLISEDSVETVLNQSGGYNVIVMGIDAISRLNFHRTMPKTLAYFKKKKAIEFLGYNKVGDNTFPNLIPMLMGIKDTDLKKTCWPNLRSTFDNCPFIWDWYKEAGYYTAFGEDSAKLGTFNYERMGFAGTPTDYYIHTFMNEAEIHVGNKKDFNTFVCMGNKYFYKVLLDYIESLSRTLKNDKLFGFFWEVTMSHDYLNYPKLMDSDYEFFLQNLDDSNYLDETVLILLSDHGMRWGDIRFTKQGRLEERLPLFQIILPASFQENFPEAYNNIQTNKRRLMTPFDIHATLTDLIDLNRLKDDQIKSRSQENYATNRSISLFLEIPSNRTCKSAGINDHWCTCHTYSRLSIDNREVYEAAVHLVRSLNMLLQEHPQCAKLKLAQIIEATEMDAGTPELEEVGWQEFMVVIRTTPGGGVFEATLRRNSHEEWVLSGTVSRLNLYGDQSKCVHHYQHKLYCYCL